MQIEDLLQLLKLVEEAASCGRIDQQYGLDLAESLRMTRAKAECYDIRMASDEARLVVLQAEVQSFRGCASLVDRQAH